MSHENVSPITGQGPESTDHPLSLERTLDRALQWIEDGDLEDAKAAIQGGRRKLDGDEDRALIAEFAALIQEINPTINRIVEGVDTERASDGDTITDVLLSCCGILGGGEPSLYINPPAETFAHCVAEIEDELRQARETGLNLVLLSSDGEVNQTWLVTDDTAAILQPLAAPQGSPAPEGSTAVSHLAAHTGEWASPPVRWRRVSIYYELISGMSNLRFASWKDRKDEYLASHHHARHIRLCLDRDDRVSK